MTQVGQPGLNQPALTSLPAPARLRPLVLRPIWPSYCRVVRGHLATSIAREVSPSLCRCPRSLVSLLLFSIFLGLCTTFPQACQPPVTHLISHTLEPATVQNPGVPALGWRCHPRERRRGVPRPKRQRTEGSAWLSQECSPPGTHSANDSTESSGQGKPEFPPLQL